jgi:hypothetical protein
LRGQSQTGPIEPPFREDEQNGTRTGKSVLDVREGNSNQAFSGVGGGSALAEFGNGNDASVVGTSTAQAGGTSADLLGNNDIATILGYGSEATAGANLADPGSFDFASVFGDILDANATGANFLVDILPSLF